MFSSIRQEWLQWYIQIGDFPFPERTRVTRSLSRHSSKSQASLDLDSLLTQKKPVQNRLLLSNLNGLLRQALYYRQEYSVILLRFTPQNSSYIVIHPWRWQSEKNILMTSFHFRWQIPFSKYFSLTNLPSKFRNLHEKSGNDFVFITAKN